MELEREKEERKRSEKRMRAAESAVIEIKNDRLLDEHDNVSTKYGLSFNIINRTYFFNIFLRSSVKLLWLKFINWDKTTSFFRTTIYKLSWSRQSKAAF